MVPRNQKENRTSVHTIYPLRKEKRNGSIVTVIVREIGLFYISLGGGMVYATDSKSVSSDGLRVRVPPKVPLRLLYFGSFLPHQSNCLVVHLGTPSAILLLSDKKYLEIKKSHKITSQYEQVKIKTDLPLSLFRFKEPTRLGRSVSTAVR
jgi:hypothetical protein